jgi:tetratricopeptide (TPR) repeat protein
VSSQVRGREGCYFHPTTLTLASFFQRIYTYHYHYHHSPYHTHHCPLLTMSTTTTTSSKKMKDGGMVLAGPTILKDPRFMAGRSLLQRGLAKEGAIDIFATLLEEVKNKYGDTSIECVPSFYEYGNALLRASMSSKAEEDDDDDDDDDDDGNSIDDVGDDQAAAATATTSDPTVKIERADTVRSAAAVAAERRLCSGDGASTMTSSTITITTRGSTAVGSTTKDHEGEKDDNHYEIENDKKRAAIVVSSEKSKSSAAAIPKEEGENNMDDEQEGEEVEKDDYNNDDDDDDDDLKLALEMMENAYAILEDYQDQQQQQQQQQQQNEDSNRQDVLLYKDWVKEECPRILLGLGDTLSAMGRHPDAADVYSRALEKRLSTLHELTTTTTNIENSNNTTIEHLQAHRRVCEATILIAEELLACPSGMDVVTVETQSLIVSASDRISYVRGYYDKARDALQEAVYCMGTLASKKIDVGQEKQDICFIATMVMGVGETLAAIEEEEKEAEIAAATGTATSVTSSSIEPVKKKAKR